MKICTICVCEKELTAFYFRKDSNNYRNQCIKCCKEKTAYQRKTEKYRVYLLSEKYKNIKKQYDIKYRKENKENRILSNLKYENSKKGKLTRRKYEKERCMQDMSFRFNEKFKIQDKYGFI